MNTVISIDISIIKYWNFKYKFKKGRYIMAVVQIKGTFMGSNVKTSTFDGNTSTAIYIDLYQAESTEQNKMVQVKATDMELLNTLQKDYSMGSVFECIAQTNAYKNNTYFKLVKVLDPITSK